MKIFYLLSNFSQLSTPFIRTKHQIDQLKLKSYLCDNNIYNQDFIVKQFGYGQSNPSYVIECNNEKLFVLRKQPPGKLLRGAHAVDREFKVMSNLKPTSVPVPKAVAFCSDPDILGTPFFIYNYVQGRFYSDSQLPTCSPAERKSFYATMIDTLARIHAVHMIKIYFQFCGR